jgi:hypothetical protein
MNEDIYLRTPVNKTAALITSQSGCNDIQTLDDKRDSLARALNSLQSEISGLPKKHKLRKDLGYKKMALQQEISVVNKLIKKSRLFDRDLEKYVVQECRNRMTRAEFHEIWCAARAAKKLDMKRK